MDLIKEALSMGFADAAIMDPVLFKQAKHAQNLC